MKRVLAALLTLVLAAPASAQLSPDRRNRLVAIANYSKFTVTGILATPLTGPITIAGDRIPASTIPPGQLLVVNFDDGFGACLYVIRAYGTYGSTWVTAMNVCTQSEWKLGN